VFKPKSEEGRWHCKKLHECRAFLVTRCHADRIKSVECSKVQSLGPLCRSEGDIKMDVVVTRREYGN
jgi:hypothetical protein